MGEEKGVSSTVDPVDTSSPPAPIHRATPLQPQKKRPKWVTTLLLIIDIGLALSPLLFLGIAIAAIVYSHRRVSDDPVITFSIRIPKTQLSYGYWKSTGGQAVIDAANVAVSIFPILFAAVVGRFAKSYALHRAEHGSPLGVLEQLYGSQSLATAAQLSWSLGGFVGAGMIVVWLLSPLGGQGVKRVLGTTERQILNDTTVYYVNTSSTHNQFASRRTFAFTHPALDDAMASVLFTDQLASNGYDIWGNVKVPFLPRATNESTKAGNTNSSSWIDQLFDSPSSSMAGLLIHNLANDTNTTFTMRTSYMDLRCDDSVGFGYTPPDFAATENGTSAANMTGYYDFLSWLGPLLAHSDMSNSTNLSDTADTGTKYNDWQYLVDVRANKTLNGVASPTTFVYAAQWFNDPDYPVKVYAYSCTPSLVWLESEVGCAYGNPCQIGRSRLTEQPKSISDDVILSTPDTNGAAPEDPPIALMMQYINNFGSLLRYGVNFNGPQPSLELYLGGAGTYATQASQMEVQSGVDWSTIAGADLSSRLATLLNTAWLNGVQYTGLAKPKIMNTTLLAISDPHSPSYAWNSVAVDGDPNSTSFPNFADYLGYDVTPVAAKQTTTFEIYQVSWVWVTVAILISVFLLFLGFLGIYFRHTNKHPDVLGFVSTLTRDNPNFEPPPKAEMLDGMEMANYYKHTKVQLVNVGEDDGQGRITLRRYQRDVWGGDHLASTQTSSSGMQIPYWSSEDGAWRVRQSQQM